MNKKILNTALGIIVILVVIIFSTLFYIYATKNKATDSVYDDVASIKEPEVNATEDFQTLMPLTGAFPFRDIMPFIFENITFTNEQILLLGFSKVTKEDWAESYTGEGSPLTISASILDGYIKNIFGQNVQYDKENFSNTKYSIDKEYKSQTNTSDVVYNSETDTYTINHIAGDGINENFIEIFEPTVSKIQGRLEIELPYVYVVYGDEPVSGVMPDGTPIGGFEYIIYSRCDYPSKTFSEELGRFSDVSEEILAMEEFNQSEYIKDLIKSDMAKVPKLTFVYEQNDEQTEYVLKEIRK